ncbi:NACHT domain-containing protein [Alkalinema pantanalense CENA528]|uniref:NACHT domain-containing protein n=1 Tax=Alkalinema pantanalense TaxID=1620705 RepID=UPI003D6EA9DD
MLGKPGSGKTILLQQLATACCNGKFKSDLIPVWIDLRQVDQSNWHFLYFLLVAMDLCAPTPNSQECIQARNQLNSLLTQGKLLILLDGLDEVPIAFRKKVQDQICWLLQHPVYRKNHVILSCRTPSIGLLKNHLFTSVKIADLNDRQVEKFVKVWLKTAIVSQDQIDHQWQYFLKLVVHTLANQNLTPTPLLLNLACWIFENTGELPHKASQFYEQAIELLLGNWHRQPQDSSSLGSKFSQPQICQKLTVHDRRQILMEIAVQKIENTPNFVLFNQSEIVNHIAQTLQLNHYRDGLAVLHTIAAQPGLLTEQANHQWFFSHLTFQEYFITQWLLSLPLTQLAEKITSQPWQQTIDQIVRSQKQADSLINVIKQAIDQMVAQDSQLQTFLDWVNQKTNTLAASYKPAAVRMFYLGLSLALTSAPSCDLARARTLDAALAIDVTLDLDFDFNLDLDFALVRVLARALDFDLDRALALARALARALDCTLALVHAPALALDCALDCTLAIDLIRALDCALDCTRTLAPELTCYLEHHKAAILAADQGGVDTFLIWWQTYGQIWIEQLRWMMIEYRNIGHAWQFNRQQQERLQQYDRANQFLVQLLKITGAVSEETRHQIEATLLLPIEVIHQCRTESAN